MVFIISIQSCKKSDVVDCTNVSATYTGQIKDIMDSNCATVGCHNATTASNGIRLDTYNNVKTSAQNSNFLCSINWKKSCNKMPIGGSKLSNNSIQLITCWIEAGSPQ